MLWEEGFLDARLRTVLNLFATENPKLIGEEGLFPLKRGDQAMVFVSNRSCPYLVLKDDAFFLGVVSELIAPYRSGQAACAVFFLELAKCSPHSNLLLFCSIRIESIWYILVTYFTEFSNVSNHLT